jgi:hypothetical protein
MWIVKPTNSFEYGLLLEKVDEDGVKLIETDGTEEVGSVYIYYSELLNVCKALQDVA